MGGRDDQAAQPLWLIVVSAVIFLVSHVIGYFFVGMTINLVDTHLHGRDAKLSEAFADARRNFAALIFLAVASSAVSLAMSLIRKRGGGLGDLAAGGVGRSWTVLTYLILPAIILEDISLRAAINRARDIHGRNLLGIAVGEVGVIALTNLLGVVGVICAGLAGFAVFTVGAGAIIPAVIVGGLVVSLVTAFTMYVRGAYYTCLYLWAVATERQGERVAAPAPLAASLSYGR